MVVGATEGSKFLVPPFLMFHGSLEGHEPCRLCETGFHMLERQMRLHFPLRQKIFIFLI